MSFGRRADNLVTVSLMPRRFRAVSTAEVFPMPDGPSITTPRPGVRRLTSNLVYSAGSTNVYVGTPLVLKTSSSSGALITDSMPHFENPSFLRRIVVGAPTRYGYAS